MVSGSISQKTGVAPAATIAAARDAWPGRRLVVSFQPHRYTRTLALLDAFPPGVARIITLEGVGHNSISESPGFLGALQGGVDGGHP